MYCDECTPGNPLQPDPSRKIHMYYVAPCFKQPLRCEQAWWTLAAIRNRHVKTIQGGLSRITKELIHSLQNNAAGVGLTINGITRIVRVKLQAFIADASGLHLLLACNGFAGRRPCFRCRSLVSKQCAEQLKSALPASGFQPLWHPRLADLIQNCNEDIWRALDALDEQVPHLSKAKQQQLEKNLGWVHLPEGLLQDRTLRNTIQPGSFLYDPLPCYFSQGIVGVEVVLLLDALQSQGITCQMLQKDMQRVQEHLYCSHQAFPTNNGRPMRPHRWAPGRCSGMWWNSNLMPTRKRQYQTKSKASSRYVMSFTA